MSWREQVACRTTPTSVFFTRDEEAPLPQAVALCADCPVRPDCLAVAIEEKDLEFGYRGGMTPRERRRAVRQSRRYQQKEAS